MLLRIIAGTSEGMAGVLNYLFIYAFMNIGAFAVVIMLRSEDSREIISLIMRGLQRHIHWLPL